MTCADPDRILCIGQDKLKIKSRWRCWRPLGLRGLNDEPMPCSHSLPVPTRTNRGVVAYNDALAPEPPGEAPRGAA
jgi:hypothetical protein